jgi:hypothetical protein
MVELAGSCATKGSITGYTTQCETLPRLKKYNDKEIRIFYEMVAVQSMFCDWHVLLVEPKISSGFGHRLDLLF